MSARRTAGMDALREAARLEAARVYGATVPECRDAPAGLGALAAEADLAERDLEAGIRAGRSNHELMSTFRVGYAQVRAARQRIERQAG